MKQCSAHVATGESAASAAEKWGSGDGARSAVGERGPCQIDFVLSGLCLSVGGDSSFDRLGAVVDNSYRAQRVYH